MLRFAQLLHRRVATKAANHHTPPLSTAVKKQTGRVTAAAGVKRTAASSTGKRRASTPLPNGTRNPPPKQVKARHANVATEGGCSGKVKQQQQGQGAPAASTPNPNSGPLLRLDSFIGLIQNREPDDIIRKFGRLADAEMDVGNTSTAPVPSICGRTQE